MAHKKRTLAKHWAPGSGTCCVCGVKFSTRHRLIAHLSDGRSRWGKPPCRASLGRFKPIVGGEVTRLDELDRQARRKARRTGRTQPQSAGLADKRPSNGQEDRPEKRWLTLKQSVSVKFLSFLRHWWCCRDPCLVSMALLLLCLEREEERETSSFCLGTSSRFAVEDDRNVVWLEGKRSRSTLRRRLIYTCTQPGVFGCRVGSLVSVFAYDLRPP